jgi:dihydrofolate synthase/folylpolyglutamate synthase
MHKADLCHPGHALERKLVHLYSLNRDRSIDLGFREPYIKLLEAFKNPQEYLPPVFHVAGTNGKGSVVAVLRSILEAGGLRAHAYTSPHLRRFNERVYLSGNYIDDEYLENLIDEAIELNSGRAVTFFEITTALAFAAFSRNPADFLLLETGLGGRLDCTNIVDDPLASIITQISYDHVEYLGKTISAIAGEKAGIIKPGRPVILGYQDHRFEAEVTEAVNKTAERMHSPVYMAGRDWSCIESSGKIRFIFDGRTTVYPRPSLHGKHQIENAGAALAALEVSMRHKPGEEQKCKGLNKIIWPGRLQEITDGPLRRIIPGGWEVYIDGGHNENAALSLAGHIEEWKKESGRPVHLIVGMLRKKDPSSFLDILVPAVSSANAVCIPCAPEEAWHPEELKNISGLEICCLEGNSVEEWMQAFFRRHMLPGKLLICGSVYLAGDVLEGYL